MRPRGYEALRQELKPGERLIWSAYPRRGIHMRTSSAIVFAVIVTIDVLVLMGIAVGRVTKPPQWLIVILGFVSLIVWAFAIERACDALRRRFTVYGLTDRRAIVNSGVVRPCTRGVHLKSLVEIDLIEGPGQIGTLRCISVPNNWYRKNKRGEIKPVPLFRAIVDPRHVRDLLTEANRDSLARR